MTISKKSMLILAGLAIGGIGVASMLSDADDGGDIPQQIKERAGRVLGSQPTGGEAGAVYNIPAQAEVTFPAMERFDLSRLFALPTEVPEAAPGVTGGATLTKKEAAMYEGLPVPAHYPKDVVAYAGTQYKPEAFLRGLTQEQRNIAYLSTHPTLKLSERGEIVQRTKKGALTAQGQAVKEYVATRSSGGGSVRSTKKSVSTPKASAKATTRRSSLRDRARAVSQ